jgi:hypothetical protein
MEHFIISKEEINNENKSRGIKKWWIIAIIFLAFVAFVITFIYLIPDKTSSNLNEVNSSNSENGIISKIKSIFQGGVSLKEIRELEEKINEAERIPDYEVIRDTYAELVEKIEDLQLSERELNALGNYSLEEYKRIKKEQYQKKLDYFERIPNLLEEQINLLRTNISLMNNPVEKAFYTNEVGRLYINKKNYTLAENNLDQAYSLVKDLKENDFFEKRYSEQVMEDGTIIPPSITTYSVREVKKRIFGTYFDLWKIKGTKESKFQEFKSKLESNPEDYDAFLLLEQYYLHNSRINYSVMLQYYLYVDALANNVSYQYYLDSNIVQAYKELGDFEGQRAFLQNKSSGDIISDIQIAQTYASQGNLERAKSYIEDLYPGSNENTCWYKAHFYNSLAFKSSNGYSPLNNTYLETSNEYFEDCKKYEQYADSYMDYYIAQNYFWMGNKTKAREIFAKIVEESESAQEIANVQNFIDIHSWR